MSSPANFPMSENCLTTDDPIFSMNKQYIGHRQHFRRLKRDERNSIFFLDIILKMYLFVVFGFECVKRIYDEWI